MIYHKCDRCLKDIYTLVIIKVGLKEYELCQVCQDQFQRFIEGFEALSTERRTKG